MTQSGLPAPSFTLLKSDAFEDQRKASYVPNESASRLPPPVIQGHADAWEGAGDPPGGLPLVALILGGSPQINQTDWILVTEVCGAQAWGSATLTVPDISVCFP